MSAELPSAEVERLLGRWRSTAGEAARGVAQVEIVASGDGVRVTPRVITSEGMRTWPSVECRVYACGEEDQQPGAAALGEVELEDASVELQIRINKGILCVMSWTRFHAPGPSAWVIRELLAREELRP